MNCHMVRGSWAYGQSSCRTKTNIVSSARHDSAMKVPLLPKEGLGEVLPW